MCDDVWASIASLQVKFDTLKYLAVIAVHGAGCAQEPGWENYANDIRESIFKTDGYVDIDVMCDSSSPRAWTQSLASCTRIMPGRTAFTDKVLCLVKERISTCRHVILLGHSYGGLIASYVAQQLRDDPRASRLHVRTTGSAYTPTDFHDIIHYLFVDDMMAIRCNWTTPPKAMDRNAVYDPAQKVFWLHNYVVPNFKAIISPVARYKAIYKIHAAHPWVMMQLLAVQAIMTPMKPHNTKRIEELVSKAVHFSEDNYIRRQNKN